MPNRQVGSKKPAQSKNNPTSRLFPTNEIFKWYSTEHNTCLAQVAEEEVDLGTDILLNEITGLGLSQMYVVLVRALVVELERPGSNRELALSTFAARIYRAGRKEGLRCDPSPL